LAIVERLQGTSIHVDPLEFLSFLALIVQPWTHSTLLRM
jgi:hypothetical protein